MKAIVQYLGQQFGGDVRVTLESGELFAVPAPKDPAEDETEDKDADGNVTKTARQKVSYVKNKTFEKQIAEYIKRKQILSTNLEKAFSIILGQCTYDLQKKLEANQNWPTIFSTQNVLDLLETIKLTTYKFDDEKYLPLFIHNAKSVYYQFDQGNMSLNAYRKKYMNNVEIATSYGSKLHDEALCDHLSEEDHGCLFKDLTDPEKVEID